LDDLVKKLSDFYKNKKVLVTGHTGFKGIWLSLFLDLLGAKVFGLSNSDENSREKFGSEISTVFQEEGFFDIRNSVKTQKYIIDHNPDIVFHLAAQSSVTDAVPKPFETWTVNTIGTVNVLESLVALKKCIPVVIVTTDKVYSNSELGLAFRESDALGGTEPYSGSKVACELLVSSLHRSQFSNLYKKVATVRAGNVIGGGDFKQNRIVPDLYSALTDQIKLNVRNPFSIRPWQHVLDPIFGYLLLGKYLEHKENLKSLNFGPSAENQITVLDLIKLFQDEIFPKSLFLEIPTNISDNTESRILRLDSSLAKKELNWNCMYSVKEAVKLTNNWYKALQKHENMVSFSVHQIKDYLAKVASLGT
jgi:CDP-glucose 4,6-dehydratase